MSSFVILNVNMKLLTSDTLGSTNETFNWREDEWHQLEDKFEGRTGNETSDAMAEDDGESSFRPHQPPHTWG